MSKKLNVKLLRQIQASILKKPTKFDMNTYADKTACGTTCCIAGQALMEKGYKVATYPDPWNCKDKPFGFKKPAQQRIVKDDAIFNTAKSFLGLIAKNQASELFLHYEWPEPFKQLYNNAKTPEAAAAIAVARIEALIQEAAHEG